MISSCFAAPAALLLLLLGIGCAASAPSPERPPAAAPGFVTGPHGRLRVDAGGRGDALPVLLVHGNGGNRTQWAETLRHLRTGRRAAALDLSGFGESEALLPQGGRVSVEGFAGDVAAAADGLGFRRFVLVGHSYGGAVVAAYAGMHPDRLAGLVFADSAGDLHGTPDASLESLRRGLREDYEHFTEKWFEGILAGARPETREAVLASLRRTPPSVFIAATEALYRFNLDAALSRYRGPRLSIASMLFDNPIAIHWTVPEMPVRRITGASHWLMMDQPEEFDADLDEFLSPLGK